MRSIFIRAFCLHEWVKMDQTQDGFKYIGARCIYKCKKCGKITLYPNY